jgi:hypothetical protein
MAFASSSVIKLLSFTINLPSSQIISQSAILFIADFQSFFAVCSIVLNGVNKNPCLSTFEYVAKCRTSQIFGPSGVAIGHILQY